MGRYNHIDFAKALCIILVLFIHTGFSALNNVILFAMPLFFAATGYTFSCDKRTPKESIVQRFKSIMVPYFYLSVFYTVLEIFRAQLFEYGSFSIAYPSLLNTVYGSGIVPFNIEALSEIMSFKAQPSFGVDLILPTNCHLWFLPAMFSAYTIFVLVLKPLKRSHLLKGVVVLALVLFASAEVVFEELRQLPFGLGRGALGAAFMLLGYWMKEYGAFEKKSSAYYILSNVIAALIFVPSLLLGSNASALVRSVYGPYGVTSVFITFIGGVAGVWLMLSLCKALDRLPFEKAKNFLSYIGKNAMVVYAWHMAVKFVFDAIYLCLIKSSDFSLLDEYNMGLMPQTSAVFMVFEALSILVICLSFPKIKRQFATKQGQISKSK